MHVLPDDGGIFDQEEQTINRLLAIYGHLEEWREIELDKAGKPGQSQEPPSIRGNR